MNRRSLLLGLGAVLAAPAIVKAENLMKVATLRRQITEGDFVMLYDEGLSPLYYVSEEVYAALKRIDAIKADMIYQTRPVYVVRTVVRGTFSL